jgi:serine/threonine protein kinase
MLFKEAENLKELTHPNIVKILNCYALNDMRVVIVMEYLEGGELLTFLKKERGGRLDEKEAKVYFRQIVSGVGYCHRKGIIHRDLKLENILIKNHSQVGRKGEGKDGKEGIPSKTLKITDFGISGVADRWNPEIDWGTLRYMAPEVLAGRTKTNTAAVDVWACGVMLFMMVVGRYPFDGTSSSSIIDAIKTKPL